MKQWHQFSTIHRGYTYIKRLIRRLLHVLQPCPDIVGVSQDFLFHFDDSNGAWDAKSRHDGQRGSSAKNSKVANDHD